MHDGKILSRCTRFLVLILMKLTLISSVDSVVLIYFLNADKKNETYNENSGLV